MGCKHGGSHLKEIAAVEEQADVIEAQAQQKAKDIISSARKEAAVLIEKEVEKAESEAKFIIQKAEEKAAKDIVDIKMDTQAKCSEIKTKAGVKMDEAVDLIVGRIVKR